MKIKLLSSTSIALALAVAAGWSPAVQAQGVSGKTMPQAQERAQSSGESGRMTGHEPASPRAAQEAEHERGPAKSQTEQGRQLGAGRGETAQDRSEHKGATTGERASEQKRSGEKAAESKEGRDESDHKAEQSKKSEQSKDEKASTAKEHADDRGKAEKNRATSEEKSTHKNGEKGAGKDAEKSAESDRTKSDRTKRDSAKSTEQERNARSRDEPNAKDRSADTERTDRSARGEDQERIRSSVKLDQRQRTRVKETFSHVDVESVRDVDFSVSIGASVPRHLHLHRLPPTIVEVVPEYRDYRYVVVNDEVVIINPKTYKVVTVIDRSGGGHANVGARGSSERISLSQDQRRVIRTHVKVEDVTPAAETDIMIGKAVPRWVELFTFPDVVVKDVGVVRPYKYFTLNHEIVLVDPDDYTIVDVLD